MTNNAGKGPEWRKGTNYKAYWDSELWDNLGKTKSSDSCKNKKTHQDHHKQTKARKAKNHA
jgi:hypothetical protein